MKLVILAFLTSVISTQVLASPKILRACTTDELKDIEVSIKDWADEEGYKFAYYMKNPQGQTVGFYSTDHDQSMYAEVCDYVDSELTTSTSWYYWEDSAAKPPKANPASWKAKASYRLTQDEGVAYIKMLKADKAGKITAEFQVMAFGNGNNEVLLMKEVVKFDPEK